MDETLKIHIQNLPEYQQLLSKRRHLNTILIPLMLVTYFGFVLALAFFPDILSHRIGEGVTTLGIVLGLALIFLTFGVTGVYIRQTDKKIFDLLDVIRTKAQGR